MSSGYTNSCVNLYAGPSDLIHSSVYVSACVCVFINQDKDINIPLTPCYDLNYVTFITAYLCGQQLSRFASFINFHTFFEFKRGIFIQSNAKLFSNFLLLFWKSINLCFLCISSPATFEYHENTCLRNKKSATHDVIIYTSSYHLPTATTKDKWSAKLKNFVCAVIKFK